MQPVRGTGRDQVGLATGMDRLADTEAHPDRATGMDPAGIGGHAPGFPGLSSSCRERRFCRRIQDTPRIRQPLRIAIRAVTTAWFLSAATTDGVTAGATTG